jgi:hypothetical protein
MLCGHRPIGRLRRPVAADSGVGRSMPGIDRRGCVRAAPAWKASMRPAMRPRAPPRWCTPWPAAAKQRPGSSRIWARRNGAGATAAGPSAAGGKGDFDPVPADLPDRERTPMPEIPVARRRPISTKWRQASTGPGHGRGRALPAVRRVRPMPGLPAGVRDQQCHPP